MRKFSVKWPAMPTLFPSATDATRLRLRNDTESVIKDYFAYSLRLGLVVSSDQYPSEISCLPI